MPRATSSMRLIVMFAVMGDMLLDIVVCDEKFFCTAVGAKAIIGTHHFSAIAADTNTILQQF